jgi:hypothetical protein
MSAAAAMAFVAAKPSGPFLLGKSGNTDQPINKVRQGRDQFAGNRRAMPGPERDRGPVAVAEERYAHRAYPASDVPFKLTVNAQKAWAKVRSLAPSAAGLWTLAGPSTPNVPDILTFSGRDYTTSGRITALAIAPTCTTDSCTLWVGAAGGGVWRTNNALANPPSWTFVSASFATNAIGTLTYDAATSTLYAGTGEPNASGDSEAGFGIYKSTDNGDTWTHFSASTSVAAMPTSCGDAPAYTGPAFNGRAISSIVVSGSTMYVGSTRAVRGVSSVTGGTVSLAPGLPPIGLWKSTDGGANFTLLRADGICINALLAGDAGRIQSSFGSARGVNHVAFDPNYATNATLYAAAFPGFSGNGGGVWRSTDDGATFKRIKTALAPANINDRSEFAVTTANGLTRMYVGDGNTGSPTAHVFRSDDVATGTPVFIDLTAAESPAGQTDNYCGGQCWYDNFVVTPAGHPDTVYIGGSFDYATYGFATNGRGVLYSTDAGVSFTDMTWDSTTKPTPPGSCCQPNPVAPNGMHPDQHGFVVSPSNPGLFFDGSDGGLVRSDGAFADISSQCTTIRGLSGDDLALCQQLLSQVPAHLYSLNKGLSTIQFQSVSVDPNNSKHLQGGNQDNGTFETYGSSDVWKQEIYGDGGLSGFNVGNSAQRFNDFFLQYMDANFQNADPSKWVVISGPLFAETSAFYKPTIADPFVAGTIFVGELSVWRTQDWGGDQTYLETNCPEFTTSGSDPLCGDFVIIGDGIPSTQLTSTLWGDRSGGTVAAVARSSTDSSTMWAATSTGRVFFSSNADAAAGSVVWERLDSSSSVDPNRFVSGITIDSTNPNHAWISYSSYSALTPATPGHVFEVTRTAPSTATWTSLDGSGATAFPDFPATAIARDSVGAGNGDLYVATDWGVLTLPNGSISWEPAGTGLPAVEVAGLTIVPSARVLYAATHGRSAWKLKLP